MYSSVFSEVGDGKVSILMKIVLFIYLFILLSFVLEFCAFSVFDCFGYYSFVFWRIEFSVIQ